MASDAPFEDSTTFKDDYRRWATERPYQHMPDEYKKPEGDMDMNTTHNITYKQHPMQRHAAVKPAQGRVMDAGRFEGTTNYNSDFKPWEINRVQPVMKPDYHPNDAPFQGISTQKAHFVQHPINMTHSFKPGHAAITSGPFEDGTMYRMEFTPKQMGPCPAAILGSGNSAYQYVEVDPRGHRIYKPVFTSVTALSGKRSATPQQMQPLAVA